MAVDIEDISGHKISDLEAQDAAKKMLNVDSNDVNFLFELTTTLFKDAPMIYLNPTEVLTMGNIVKSKNDAVATVLSGGDFTIDFAYHGVRDILTFDINKNQLYAAQFKLAALECLDSYDEYCDFYLDSKSNSYMSWDIYQKIKEKYGKSPLFAFYDILMDQREKDKKYILDYLERIPILKELYEANDKEPTSEKVKNLKQSIVDNTEWGKARIEDCDLDVMLSQFDVNYQPSRFYNSIQGVDGYIFKGCYHENEESFNKAREAIKDAKIKFVNADIANLKNKLNSFDYTKNPSFKGFDAIYLSNIPEYINGGCFLNIVNSQLMPLLSDRGRIVYCCQGVDINTLNMSQQELLRFKYNAAFNQSVRNNPLIDLQQVNDIEGYQLLKNYFDVTTEYQRRLSPFNGNDPVDTFVYVRKR